MWRNSEIEKVAIRGEGIHSMGNPIAVWWGETPSLLEVTSSVLMNDVTGDHSAMYLELF